MGDKRKALLTVLILGIQLIAKAQAGSSSEGEGLMRSDGKIYVVVAVVPTILVGFILYMVRLDRKITWLEKQD